MECTCNINKYPYRPWAIHASPCVMLTSYVIMHVNILLAAADDDREVASHQLL